MKITARRFAIEWLWAFGSWLVGYCTALALNSQGSANIDFDFDGEAWAFVFLIPYAPILLIRLTIWAIKTAQKKETT